MAATQENDIHDVLYRVLQIIQEILNLEMGWVYLYNSERAQFHLASWNGVPRELEPDLLSCDMEDLCSCQRKLVDGTLPHSAFQEKCERLGRPGKKKHAVIMLQNGDQPLGAILLASVKDRHLNAEELKLLELVGGQISEIVSNAWLEMKLGEKETIRQRLLRALIKAQEDERSHLARELHDGAGQTLTSLMVRMKALEKQVGDSHLQLTIQALCEQLSGTIEYVRVLSHQMRPAVLEEIGLEQAVANLVENMASEGNIKWSLDLDMEGLSLPDDLETIVYRVVQESLTNVLRHAEADEVRVSLRRQNGLLLFEIQDNGRGFREEDLTIKPNARGLGILGMRERVELLEGKLRVSSRAGKGTLISGELPVIEEAGRWEKVRSA
jgi:signal transduction histidine kinase